MARIYVVTSGEYSSYRIERVFSTEELAIAWIGDADHMYEIEEYKLDNVSDPPKSIVACWISLDTEANVFAQLTELIPGRDVDNVIRRFTFKTRREDKKCVESPQLYAAFMGCDKERAIKAMAEIRQKFIALHQHEPSARDGGPGLQGTYDRQTLARIAVDARETEK